MEGFQELLQDYEKIIGWQFLRGLHINDSKGVHVFLNQFVSKYISQLVLSFNWVILFKNYHSLLEKLQSAVSIWYPGLILGEHKQTMCWGPAVAIEPNTLYGYRGN